MIDAHATPEDMVRCLVSYIDDDERIRHEVRSNFESTMGLESIRGIRKQRERQVAALKRGRVAKNSNAGWDWRGDQLRTDMEIASAVFVKAIERERAA